MPIEDSLYGAEAHSHKASPSESCHTLHLIGPLPVVLSTIPNNEGDLLLVELFPSDIRSACRACIKMSHPTMEGCFQLVSTNIHLAVEKLVLTTCIPKTIQPLLILKMYGIIHYFSTKAASASPTLCRHRIVLWMNKV